MRNEAGEKPLCSSTSLLPLTIKLDDLSGANTDVAFYRKVTISALELLDCFFFKVDLMGYLKILKYLDELIEMQKKSCFIENPL